MRNFLFKIRIHLLIKLWTSGLYLPPDRRLLERVFIPAFAGSPDIKRVLFVGVADYCDYRNHFNRGEYITIDPNVPAGPDGRGKHIQDTLQNLGHHFSKHHFDLIIMNGVLGWGLNDPDDIELAIQACHAHLQKGGLLLIGLNETGGPAKVSLNSIKALAMFESCNLPTMQSYRIDFAHPFDHDFTFAMFRCG